MTQKNNAKFIKGSTMRHVVVMSLSSSIGLVAVFLVDLVDMYFLSLLGEIELASAIGYAGSILFFTTSVCIGLAISMGAIVSRSIGGGDTERAKHYLINIYVVILVITIILAFLIWMLIPFLVSLMGAVGRSAELSIAYLRIMIPSMPIIGLAISSGAALRAVGDAKRSMFSTLAGGTVNAILDPFFIFTLDLGVEGAAIASVFARFTMLIFAFYPIYKHHQLLTRFNLSYLIQDIRPIFTIAIPAILTNIATPVANGYVTASMAKFGDSAVAGISIIGRLIPVAFGVVYAVSGAVGPIIGQNFGAKDLKRVRGTITDAFLFVAGYVSIISLILLFSSEFIGKAFNVDVAAGHLIDIFCFYVSFTFIFSGATFVGNAAFNNLGKPNFSTLVNWGKATIGTIPFVYFGALWFQAPGILIGQSIGNLLFGGISILTSYRLVYRLDKAT
jgi:putative MATE family efflux protein